MANPLCFIVRMPRQTGGVTGVRVWVLVLCLIATAAPLLAGLKQGLASYREGDYVKALREFQMAAESGDATAMFSLGFMYLRGEGTTASHSEAARWLQLAAEQGLAPAQHSLALLYYEGRGVERNATVAANYFESAALQGLPDAQYNLAVLYARGDGVKQDWTLARFWHQKAAEQGNTDAQLALGVMAANGLGVRQNYQDAALWFGKAAAGGNRRAQTMFESAFSKLQGTLSPQAEVADGTRVSTQNKAGTGVAKDVTVAAAAYSPAPSSLESPPGLPRPARFWEVPPPKIDKFAFHNLQGLASSGDAEAQLSLAWHYLHGVAAPQSLVRSYVWAARAGRKGNPEGVAMAKAIHNKLDARQKSATAAILDSPSSRKP